MKTMKKEKLADILNGNEYLKEMTNEQERFAKDNNLLVMFGASYCSIKIRGAIHDEIGECDGGDFSLILKGETFSDDEDVSISHESECVQVLPLSEDYDNDNNTRLIRVEWLPKDDPYLDWRIDTKIPHSKFTIYDEGDPYCEGIIIDLDEVEKINQ